MRIALVHNLQTDSSEAQAEFDPPETIAALTQVLEHLGHQVTPVDVSASFGRAVTILEELRPDLVLNTAEGRGGPLREALFPALFEELGLAYTGSGPMTCALTLDKHETKRVVAQAGVPTPPAVLVTDLAKVELDTLPVPAIVKPNFEGSSKGVSSDSIVRDPARFPELIADLLGRYPAGILVEAFVPGRDLTVPWLEAVAESGGVLPAAEYLFDGVAGDSHAIYDFAHKQHGTSVAVRAPAKLDAAVAGRLRWMARRVVSALRVRDLARLDFRIDAKGELWFLELNALPSLEPGASLYESAATVGLRTPEAVLGALIASATRRQRALMSSKRSADREDRAELDRSAIVQARPVRVGLIYNLQRVDPRSGDDRDAEFDPPRTIAAVRAALESLGVEVVELEATRELPRTLPDAHIDLAFNMSEGIGGRGREAQVPALLELLGIACTGSDAVTMALTLDKALAKSVVAAAGVRTPAWAVLRRGDEPLPAGLSFPVFVKPVAEGSSKGIDARAVAEDEATLRRRARELIERYGQPALVESFLPGREFSVGILELADPATLPPMEIVHLGGRPRPVYGYDSKVAMSAQIRYDTPARLDDEPQLREALSSTALAAFHALGCRDLARVDLRLDAAGEIHFIECNPLPGLTPLWSDLCMIASSAGLGYEELIAAILTPALRRAGLGPLPAAGATLRGLAC